VRIDVALPLPFPTLFTYEAPAHLAPRLAPGARVLVPFRSRRMIGLVVGPGSADLPDAKIKSVLAAFDREPLVEGDVFRLCRWIADYYLAPPGEAFALALPAAALRAVDPKVGLTPEGAAAAASGPPVLRELAARKGATLTWAQREAERWARFEELLEKGWAAVRLPGARVRSGAGAYALAEGPVEELLRRCGRAPRRRAVVEWLAAHGGRADAEALRAGAGAAGALLLAMARAGLLRRLEEERAYGLDSHLLSAPATALHALTPGQEAAFAPVREALDRGGFNPFLLQGVTGSGKTEVYLHAVRRVLESGGRVLYLVPEIALTPAAAARLRALFPGRVSLFHSGLSEGERLQEFHQAWTGEARVVVGTRSALFLPLAPLRLVVVDEEQETAYKQEEPPRYHARDAALVRAREAGAAVVLGSATPSMESLANADRGKYTLLTLAERVEARPLPRITVVDTRSEVPAPGDHGRVLFSKPLLEALDRCFATGDQAILLLNRRGWAPLLLCRLCGHAFPCPDCSVSHTLHRRPRVLLCHYCGHRAPVPSVCPACGGAVLEDIGFATEKVAQRFRERFPSIPHAVLDRDAVSRRGRLAETLRGFAAGRLRALIGTQMVAKGHDFPGVALVGILSADQVLNFPDFRAAERLFSLLVQVAGRAGRGSRPGEVVVQTGHPDHYSIRLAAVQDVRAFFTKEREFREAFHYPPAGHLALLSFSGDSEAEAEQKAETAARALRASPSPKVRILGPAPAPLERIKGKYRWQIVLRAPDRPSLHRLLAPLARSRAFEGALDVDPQSLL
jgi:primosomal protein N' (replication factor Y)